MPPSSFAMYRSSSTLKVPSQCGAMPCSPGRPAYESCQASKEKSLRGNTKIHSDWNTDPSSAPLFRPMVHDILAQRIESCEVGNLRVVIDAHVPAFIHKGYYSMAVKHRYDAYKLWT